MTALVWAVIADSAVTLAVGLLLNWRARREVEKAVDRLAPVLREELDALVEALGPLAAPMRALLAQHRQVG